MFCGRHCLFSKHAAWFSCHCHWICQTGFLTWKVTDFTAAPTFVHVHPVERYVFVVVSDCFAGIRAIICCFPPTLLLLQQSMHTASSSLRPTLLTTVTSCLAGFPWQLSELSTSCQKGERWSQSGRISADEIETQDRMVRWNNSLLGIAG